MSKKKNNVEIIAVVNETREGVELAEKLKQDLDDSESLLTKQKIVIIEETDLPFNQILNHPLKN